MRSLQFGLLNGRVIRFLLPESFCRNAFIITAKEIDFGFASCWFTSSCLELARWFSFVGSLALEGHWHGGSLFVGSRALVGIGAVVLFLFVHSVLLALAQWSSFCWFSSSFLAH